MYNEEDMELDTRYATLNAARKKAVDTIQGPVMVVAGPGTGKTELLSVRAANILVKTDTLPENILCLTFTESGATAMRERLISIIGKDAYRIAIHTFHSFGTETIGQNREFFYNGALFEPIDDLRRYELLRDIFGELPHDNILASTMNGEYTYQSEAATVISELKRSGLTSEELRNILNANEVTLDSAERLICPIFERIGKTTSAQLAAVMADLRALANADETRYEVAPLSIVLHDSLYAALQQTEEGHPTKPLTAWKRQWLTKDRSGRLTFKSRASIKKLRALAVVYDAYLHRLEQVGLYDYDDMILQLVHAMEVHPELKFSLQEKYQYIMVDEFQDTNLAQMRILHNLTDNPVNEGRPNLMVVGDDDQAIYSFQGADISNILRFRELYPSAIFIPLTDNYRSRKQILTEARQLITQVSDRLETRYDELDKTLSAHQPGDGTVTLTELQDAPAERQWLVDRINADIAAGKTPQDIAVLTRHHKEITALLPYFAAANIPVTYERQDNALDEAPITTLELVSKLVIALAKGEHDVANSLLPEFLAHPALATEPLSLWRLSVSAYDARQRWMETMAAMAEFVDIHAWLVELAQASLQEPLEVMLDRIIGQSDTPSPFYTHYFSRDARDQQPDLYLQHLQALQIIRQKLREYTHTDAPTLSEFSDFVALHRRLDMRIPLTRTIGESGGTAVHLMTAHKSKGLEFPTVYVVNAVDSTWGDKARGRSRLISYPENLRLAPAGDSADERVRLLYVAMTRAKHDLHLSYSLEDDRGKSTLVARFFADHEAQRHAATDSDGLLQSAQTAWYAPYAEPTTDLKTLLAPSLAHYKLSATHLNAFLDLVNGGPEAFLLGNLLHFPSAKTPASSYGTAVHHTLQLAHLHLARHGERKPLEDILHDFETHLSQERMKESDKQFYLQKGSEQLTRFFEERYDTFSPEQKAELDFRHQEVCIDQARLTGMLDVATIDKQNKTIAVADYKTGKPVDGTPKTEYEKIKIHKYRQQLLFYKLLVEHSRDYHSYTVTDARLVFVEPTQAGAIIDLPIEYDKEELDRLRLLIEAVWRRITTLDFPDTSEFEPSLKGIQAFEQSLMDEVA